MAASALRAVRGVAPLAGEEQLPQVVAEATGVLDDVG